MDDQYIKREMIKYLHRASQVLVEWLGKVLPQITDDWWNECVLDRLSRRQRENAIVNGIKALSDFDLAAILQIVDRNWYGICNFISFTVSERELIRDMRRVRSNWIHCEETLPGKDSILHDVEILIRFFGLFSTVEENIKQLEEFRSNIENENVSRIACQVSNHDEGTLDDIPVSETVIKEKDIVYLVGDPKTRGMVSSVENIGPTIKYEVFVDGGLRTYYSGQIALIVENDSYKWVDVDTFQRCMSAYEINNPSTENLYSLNSARVDFVPYQFRPALKLIKADEPRILIADSVGVGKTIEAGLIIKELEARSELSNIVIICPKPLVSERKWELEMKRFDEDFIPLNGREFRQILSDSNRDGVWPSRFNKIIIPYSIFDSRVYGDDGDKNRKLQGLLGLDPAPHFDLVIIDEAHHIRNGSPDKEKAYAYKCTKYFCDHADAVVMLTATPLQTGDDDLFTLLNILRPDIVMDKATFNLMSKPNEFISKTSYIVREAAEGWQTAAAEMLHGVLKTQWGENVVARNPVYRKVISALADEELTREERVQLISDIESLHSFDTMLNRTRRKDIQDFCIRRTHTRLTEFTAEQRELHDELLHFEYLALSTLHNVRLIPFMMSTLKRQAASCIFGLAPHLRDIINRRFATIFENFEIDIDKLDFDEMSIGTLKKLAGHVLVMADNLPDEDPKFEQLLDIVREKQQAENNKIIIFSTFRHTLAYIRRKLEATGLKIGQIDGSVRDELRSEFHDRFALPKGDENALDILLFTEVGSEGLDYQFCDLMINYDLPWNPMKIEQRIGRIDRRGQESEVVNIYNMITSGTVDADIYDRCLLRIGVFEKSIGECEAILGKIGEEIERIAVNANLTAEERRFKLEQMADNEIRMVQELNRLEEEQKGLFGFDLSNYTMTKEIQAAESTWLTPRSLQYLVEGYLSERLGNVKHIMGENDVKTLRLSASDREVLRQDFKELSSVKSSVKRQWGAFLKGSSRFHKITFEPESAAKNRDAFFITAVHPLVKQAANYFSASELLYINLKTVSDLTAPGSYPFAVYAWNYVGMNPHFKLMPICKDEKVNSELIELIQMASTEAVTGTVPADTWDGLEEIQLGLWIKEKEEHRKAVASNVDYKLESIRNNYTNKKRLLESRIADAMDVQIARMHRTDLENTTERYVSRVTEIENCKRQADIHVTLIAKGIMHIEGLRTDW